jgi:hypothetical protein
MESVLILVLYGYCDTFNRFNIIQININMQVISNRGRILKYKMHVE